MTLTKKLSICWMTIRRLQTMQTIHAYLPDGDLEARIADVVITTTALAKAKQKYLLRQALAELAELKRQRHPSVIHRLDCENGLGDLV